MSELSFNEIRDLLSQALNANNTTGSLEGYWVIDVYSNWFVYQDYANSATFKRDYAIGTDGKVTLGAPVKVIENKQYVAVEMAAFSLEGDYNETDDFVIVKGKIFEAGEFPDKHFAITTEELANVAKSFKPVPVDYSHVEGPLDGKLGELRSVQLADNGKDLLGEVAIPKWLDKALGDTARKVSCTWNRTTKQLEKLALVNNPRISDAVLYAAFVADQQEKKEQDAEFVGKRNNATDEQTIQKIHDHCMSLGAKCSGENAEYSSDKPNQNKELDKTMSDTNQIDFKDSAEFKAQQAEIERMRAEMDRMKDDQRHAAASARVKELISIEKKALPSQQLALEAAFYQAFCDDAKDPAQVNFAVGKQGSRVDALNALFETLDPHKLFAETTANNGQILTASFGGNKDKEELNPDRIKELKNLTPVGRASLAN